ncbi:uncharacterized protein [Asterias amurensis]|uniref:uncharacterized protein n=1 Tax=Asterias amurensis TaxID=7602 RepID=UPI003AB75997
MAAVRKRKGLLRSCLLICLMTSLPIGVLSTTCPIDPELEVGAAGNSYDCPDTLPDGTVNTYNSCCVNDRADENGDYHTCCQDPEIAKAESMGKFYALCGTIGGVTAGIMLLVFVKTYCQDDTFKCLRPIKKELNKWFALISDALCFCGCCPKKLRRKTKNDTNEKGSKVNKSGDPSTTEVNMDDFWM